MSDFAFSKINYILLAIGFAIVLLGFILMSGEGTTEELEAAGEEELVTFRRKGNPSVP